MWDGAHGSISKARPFVTITVSKAKRAELTWFVDVAKFKVALTVMAPTCSAATNRAGQRKNSGRRTCN